MKNVVGTSSVNFFFSFTLFIQAAHSSHTQKGQVQSLSTEDPPMGSWPHLECRGLSLTPCPRSAFLSFCHVSFVFTISTSPLVSDMSLLALTCMCVCVCHLCDLAWIHLFFASRVAESPVRIAPTLTLPTLGLDLGPLTHQPVWPPLISAASACYVSENLANRWHG